MRQYVATTKGAGLFALVFFFLVLGIGVVGESPAFSSPPPNGSRLPTSLAVSIESASSQDSMTRLGPLRPRDLSLLSTDRLPASPTDENGDRFCHHAYAGPLPSWECHHPDSAFSLSPHYAPAGLPESGILTTCPGTTIDLLTKILPSGSPFLVSPEIPPRRAFSL